MDTKLNEINKLFSEIFEDADNLKFDSEISSKVNQLHKLCNLQIAQFQKEIERLNELKRLSTHHRDYVMTESAHFFENIEETD